jgi:hypothetical protein
MKHLTLVSLVAATLAAPIAHTAQAASWDLASDFVTASNTTYGPWTFGWEAPNGLNGTLTNFDAQLDTGGAIKYWWYDSGSLAGIGKNVGTQSAYGIAPGEVALHPGQNDSFSVARWTAPVSGAFDVNGAFGTGDLGWVSYYISVNGKTSIESLSNPGSLTFSFNRQLNAGDTIDFIVGVPRSPTNTSPWQGYSYGNTPLAATITAAVPEPETYAMMMAGLGLLGFMAKRKKSV